MVYSMVSNIIGEYISWMAEWIQIHEALFWWVGVLSLIMFAGSLGALALMVVKLPAEHFVREYERRPIIPIKNPAARICYQVVKNGVGIFFIAAGLVMLVLPGQGLIALVLGISLTDFPGRHGLVRAIVRRKKVLRSMNWLRKKFDRPPLRSP